MFSIILPIYDPQDRFVASGAIQRSLERLLSLEGEYEGILVNNNPLSTSPQMTGLLRSFAAARPKRLKLVEPDANLGTARGFNAGLRVSDPRSSHLVFMSADTDIVDPQMLRRIKKELVQAPNVGIAHPISVYEDNNEYNYSSSYSNSVFYGMVDQQVPWESAEISAETISEIRSAIGARRGINAPRPSMPLTFAVISRELIERVGSFDEENKLICAENNDLAYRALLAGYKVGRFNGVFVNHRRLLFYYLTLKEEKPSVRCLHSEGLKLSTVWWEKKWGKPYVELYAKWRWGSAVYRLMGPYFLMRRVGLFLRERKRPG